MTKKKTNDLCRTQAEAADYCGVTRVTVRNWVKQGLKKKDDLGYLKSDLDLFNRKGRGNQTQESDEEIVAWRKLKEKSDAERAAAVAKLKEMELAIAEGRYLDADEVEKNNIKKIMSVKRGLLGLPRKLAKKLSTVKDSQRISDIIDNEVRSLISKFSKGYDKN